MNLRPYQQSAVDDVVATLDRRPVLVMPTGAGKTLTASHLVEHLGVPTLWLAHRRELVQQAAETLGRYGLDVGIIMSGEPYDPRKTVQVASAQTVARRTLPFAPALAVVDECHHVRASTYAALLERLNGARLLGLTATPFRTDGLGLGDAFGHIVVACYPDDLCANGTLVEPVVYAPAEPQVSGLHRRGGDYALNELAELMSKPQLVGDIVRTWQKRGAGRRTVVFAVNVHHSEFIVRAFRANGVRAEHLDGNTSRGQRDATLHRLRTGYTTVVSNCQVLTEGWDLPALEVAIVARPTASLCLHLQMVGRIMRCADDKAGAIVLDHAGNHLRHGQVTQRLTYSLDDGAFSQAGEAPKSKRCPDCFIVVDPGTRLCPECGHVWAPSARPLPKTVDGELVEYTASERRSAMHLSDMQAAWDRLEHRRRLLGYREGWSWYQFKHLHGFSPLVIDGEVVDGKRATMAQKRKHYDALMRTARERGYRRGWCAHQYRAAFGVWPRFGAA